MSAIRALMLTGCVAIAISSADAAPKKSSDVVKVDVKASKPDAGGNQVLTITLAMDPTWHTYANPVGNMDLITAQTKIDVAGKTKLDDVKIEYPEGTLIKDKAAGDYKVYEGKVTISAKVRRAKGDTGPLEVTVRFQACTDQKCLLPASVKVPVP